MPVGIIGIHEHHDIGLFDQLQRIQPFYDACAVRSPALRVIGIAWSANRHRFRPQDRRQLADGDLGSRNRAAVGRIASERTSHGALAARAGYLARQPCPCIGRHLGQRIGSRIDTGGQVDPWQGRIGKCPRHRIDPPTMAGNEIGIAHSK